MLKDNTFTIILDKFYQGIAPLTHLSSLTSIGNAGQASVMSNVDIISNPELLTQGSGLATLTNGTEAGAVTELVNHILDIPVTSDVTYGIAATKLHKISPTAVTNSGGVFPHAITGATSGSSVIEFQGKLYYFYNKTSGADCGMYDLNTTFDDDYFSTIPTGAAALQNAPHPVAKKEDIMLFGNGRYVGTFISSTVTLAPTKLDFGANTEIADVAFHANQWWIAVNSGVISGTNRARGQIYLYDGAAISSLLSDEVALGVQQIGFIFPINGIVYVVYKDISGVNAVGYISGRQIKPLRYFSGTLPTFAQKTFFKNTIIFLSSGLIYSAGAVIEQLPVQLSQLASGGFTTAGALAAPFGVPMVASTQSTSFKLAKFSGYDTACSWKSIVLSVINGRYMGAIDNIVVLTKTLGVGASATLIIEADQAASTGTTKTIATTGKRRHLFTNFALASIEDFRIAISWSGGSASNDCGIRQIIVNGHWVEK